MLRYGAHAEIISLNCPRVGDLRAKDLLQDTYHVGPNGSREGCWRCSATHRHDVFDIK